MMTTSFFLVSYFWAQNIFIYSLLAMPDRFHKKKKKQCLTVFYLE